MNYVNELLPDMLFQAPDLSDAALTRALQLGVQDLFRESDLWVQELPPIALFSNLDRYLLRLPKGTRVAKIEWVKLDNEELQGLDREDIVEDREVGYHLTNDEPHQLLVTPKTPRGNLRVMVRLYPTPATTEIPDWLVHDFRTAMVNAGLVKVYGQPGSPWFDPNLAQLLAVQIDAMVLRGKRLVNNRKQGRPRTVRYGGL
jgi:hypothetical protein